jgi:hypothetical protein
MQMEALKLRGPINKIERLLGHNLALTEQVLLDRVKAKIDEKENELGLKEIRLDHAKINWGTIIHAASYRLPPFQPGEKEKGFRDMMVAESFLQLLADSPKTPNVCRVVLVSDDQLLSKAIQERIASSPNASVIPSIEELKGLINTLVSNVSEDFIVPLQPKAAKLFFVSSDDKDTLIFKERIIERIKEEFKAQLELKPEGTSFRQNGAWHVNRPNFSRKEGRRVFWTSRIEVDIEAGTLAKKQESVVASPVSGGYILENPVQSNVIKLGPTPYFIPSGGGNWADASISTGVKLTNYSNYYEQFVNNAVVFSPSSNQIVTIKGTDIYEVLWSTEVTMTKELRKSAIDQIKHIELKVEPI